MKTTEKDTDTTPQTAIADQLALVTTALEDCFAKARGIDQAQDEYGHRRGREFTSAVTLLKASAKLGLALAKIKGEFNQTIRVDRGEGGLKSGGSNGGT